MCFTHLEDVQNMLHSSDLNWELNITLSIINSKYLFDVVFILLNAAFCTTKILEYVLLEHKEYSLLLL